MDEKKEHHDGFDIFTWWDREQKFKYYGTCQTGKETREMIKEKVRTNWYVIDPWGNRIVDINEL